MIPTLCGAGRTSRKSRHCCLVSVLSGLAAYKTIEYNDVEASYFEREVYLFIF